MSDRRRYGVPHFSALRSYGKDVMTEPTYNEVVLQLAELRGQYNELQVVRETEREEFRLQLEARPTQGVLEAVLAERNTAQQALRELEQERARLYDLLQQTVSGVQSWVPDLTPVGEPPAGHDAQWNVAWLADQIARRRQDWDRFVQRVVTQANS